MSSTHSVSQYIEGLKNGDEEAAQHIWERFLERLIRLANKKLKASPRKAMDEEDVVQVAFAQFFEQVKQDRFSKLRDRDDLWQILAMLVDRRATDQIRKQTSLKAGHGKVHTESIFMVVGDPDNNQGIGKVPDRLPTPELAVELTEVFRQRINSLEATEQQVAILKMRGFNNPGIAEELDVSLRKIERCLQNIRRNWNSETSQ